MITNTKVSGYDLERIVSRIEEAVRGEDTAKTAIACSIVTIFSQKPDINPAELQAAVKGISEWLTAFLGDGVVH